MPRVRRARAQLRENIGAMESDHPVVIVGSLLVAGLSVFIAVVMWRTIRKVPNPLSSWKAPETASEWAWSIFLGLMALVGAAFGIWLARKQHA